MAMRDSNDHVQYSYESARSREDDCNIRVKAMNLQQTVAIWGYADGTVNDP
jgi:hypothetical protein